ncbi:unnamed protein product [Closterium sp. Naga37s-1]|nr:unnamed protein product [Closterium sp. Naga37s-1]
MERICYIGGCSTSPLTSSAPPSLASFAPLFPHLLCSALLSPPLVPFPPPDGQQATGNNHGQQATRSDRIGARAKPFPPLHSPLLPDGQQATGSDRIGARAKPFPPLHSPLLPDGQQATGSDRIGARAKPFPPLHSPLLPDGQQATGSDRIGARAGKAQVMGSKPRGAIVSAHVLARLRSWRGRHKQSESRWGQALVKVKAQAPGEGDAE